MLAWGSRRDLSRHSVATTRPFIIIRPAYLARARLTSAPRRGRPVPSRLKFVASVLFRACVAREHCQYQWRALTEADSGSKATAYLPSVRCIFQHNTCVASPGASVGRVTYSVRRCRSHCLPVGCSSAGRSVSCRAVAASLLPTAGAWGMPPQRPGMPKHQRQTGNRISSELIATKSEPRAMSCVWPCCSI